MKKITKIALVASALTLNLYAETVSDLHIGASNAEVLTKSFTEFNIGYGASVYTQSHIFLGMGLDFAYGNLDLENQKSAEVYTYSADFKLGYALLDDKLALYALGVGALQSIDSVNGAGFGYGAGVDYRITKNIALNLEYKTYDMTSDKMPNYTYEKINSNLKYTF